MISAVGGEVALFDLSTLEIRSEERQQGWATACELLSTESRLVTTDNESGGMAVYQIPSLERVESMSLSGTPVDLRLDRYSLSAHVITRNGLYFRIPFSSLLPDTLDTGPSPRRIRFRPPSDLEAWITCPGDMTVRVIDMQGPHESGSISFAAACTDVCFTPDGGWAYCAVPGTQRLYKVAAGSHTITDSLLLQDGSVDLAICDAGRYVAAADSVTGRLRVFDLQHGASSEIFCGTEARRVRYSVSRSSFFVLCPQESWVLRVDPSVIPLTVQDTLRVASSPQCMAFLE
ncbi:MAG: hypothetical protein H6506_00550 [Calditrichaeota bacterium]|nr:hypothetical protein [Calditrichota bacterium]MCB9391126.1 hypothetical protein [Calditrichota bacterium]